MYRTCKHIAESVISPLQILKSVVGIFIECCQMRTIMENGINLKGCFKVNENEEKTNSFMMKVATFVVDKRNLFFLLFAIAVVFSMVARNWVSVENSLSAYLPQSSETKQGLDLMKEEYVTYGTANIMLTNIDYEKAQDIADEIADTEGVAMVQFDDTTDHYNNFSALYSITFSYPEDDDQCLEILTFLKQRYEDYDMYVSTTLGDQESEIIAKEMSVIIVYVAIIVVVVLLLTSQTYAEVPVLILTFLASAAMAMGTNFILGTISFVSNSVTVVLQLALSIDYAVIFCNRFKEEHKIYDAREATIIALSKAIPEISASSLTTVGGLAAMMFMQFGIGPDMGICLIKAIILSLLAVFLLMPGLLVIFAPLMDKTVHKNFVPDIPFVGKFAYKTRYVVPPLFLVAIIGAYVVSSKCPYVYGYSTLSTPIQNETQIAAEMIDSTFTSSNMVAVNVPSGSFETETEMIAYLESLPEVKSVTGLANTEAMDGYTLTDKLNARQFAELIDMDYEVGEILYTAYAVNDENYAKIVSGISNYSVPFVDMFLFAYDEVKAGYVTLDDETWDTLNEAHDKIMVAKDQLVGENYDRFLVYLTLPEEGETTFNFLNELHNIGKKFYGREASIVLAGESTSQYDLEQTFSTDNTVVTVVSILVVLVVLLFTFNSVGMPILLIMVIEGSIWINFSYPTIAHQNLFFMGYLIVSSIQMGANIDYAIVVSSRYMDLKKTMPREQAIIETMNFAFPTIITSGSMLAIAGILIGRMTSEPCIMGIGECLGRGTIISIFIVMFVLPQILLLGDKVIEKTSFTVSVPIHQQQASGLIRVDGLVNGQVNGSVVGMVHGYIRGDVNAVITTGEMKEEHEGDEEDEEDDE